MSLLKRSKSGLKSKFARYTLGRANGTWLKDSTTRIVPGTTLGAQNEVFPGVN